MLNKPDLKNFIHPSLSIMTNNIKYPITQVYRTNSWNISAGTKPVFTILHTKDEVSLERKCLLERNENSKIISSLNNDRKTEIFNDQFVTSLQSDDPLSSIQGKNTQFSENNSAASSSSVIEIESDYNHAFTDEFYQRIKNFLDEHSLQEMEAEEIREEHFRIKKNRLAKFHALSDHLKIDSMSRNCPPILCQRQKKFDLGSSTLRKRRESLMINSDTEAKTDTETKAASPESKRSLIKLEISTENEEILLKVRKSVFFKEPSLDGMYDTNFECRKSPKLSKNQKSPHRYLTPKTLILNSIVLIKCERNTESSSLVNIDDIHL